MLYKKMYSFFKRCKLKYIGVKWNDVGFLLVNFLEEREERKRKNEKKKGLKEKGEGGRKEKRKEAIKDEKGKKNSYRIYTQILIIAGFYLFVNNSHSLV